MIRKARRRSALDFPREVLQELHVAVRRLATVLHQTAGEPVAALPVLAAHHHRREVTALLAEGADKSVHPVAVLVGQLLEGRLQEVGGHNPLSTHVLVQLAVCRHPEQVLQVLRAAVRADVDEQ